MIVGWGWYEKENTHALANTLKQAIAVYGLPKVFYCDNGSVFRSGYLQLTAAKLGIALVHSQPYDSPSRGKIERFYKTVRTKFLAGINASKLTLEEFKLEFSQWLDKEYHKMLHRGIGQRPLDKYLKSASEIKIKNVTAHELDNYFLQYITRKVKKDATISIAGKLYEAPPEYIGKTVELSFPVDQPNKISLIKDGKPVIQIKEVNLIENANKPYTSIHFKNIQQKEETEGRQQCK